MKNKYNKTDAFKRLNQEFLLQQGIENFTDKNLAIYGLDEEYFKLVGETKDFWITRYTEGNDVIDIVYKNPFKRMECFEL